MSTGLYKSPDGQHSFDLVFEGEIRFGPSYFTIKLDGKQIVDRIFGEEFKWHPDSTFLALQEWLTTDYKKGPITALLLVDLKTRKFARISQANQGFIKPLKFENDTIIFEKADLANGKTVEYEIKLADITNWQTELKNWGS